MATSAPEYFHTIDGRLRIKISAVKRSPANALHVERRLAMLEGITEVSANPKTGNVLVHYDAELVDQHGVLVSLHGLGYLEHEPATAHHWKQGPLGVHKNNFSKVPSGIARNLVEFAVQTAIAALI